MPIDEDTRASLSRIETPIVFSLPDNSKVTINFKLSAKIHEIKDSVYREANVEETRINVEPSAFVLKSQQGSEFLADDLADLMSFPYIRHCLAEKQPVELAVAEKRNIFNRREKLLAKYIGTLVGKPLVYFDNSKDLEIHAFRRNIISVRKSAIERRPALFDFAPVVAQDSAPLPAGSGGKVPDSILFCCHMADNKIERTVKVMLDETPSQVIDRIVGFISGSLHTSFYTSDDLVLKISGQTTYLTGEYRIGEYKYIRDSLKEGKHKVDVIMVEKEALIEAEADLYEETVPEELPDRYNRDPELCSLSPQNWRKLETMSLWDMSRRFRLRVLGIDGMQKLTAATNVDGYWIEADVVVGGKALCPTQVSKFTPSQSGRFDQYLSFDIPVADIPLETRVCLTVWGKRLTKSETKARNEVKAKKKNQKEKGKSLLSNSSSVLDEDSVVELDHGRGKENVPLGWTNILLIDFQGALIQGSCPRMLWEGNKANFIGTLAENPSVDAPTLHIEFDEYHLPVVFPKVDRSSEEEVEALNNVDVPPCTSEDDMRELNRILSYDPIRAMSDADRKLIWMYRYHLKDQPEALTKFWKSVKMSNRVDVAEAQRLVLMWAPMLPLDALELLDYAYSDAVIRKYAVDCLGPIDDESLLEYLLQLVQVLKFEPYTDSPLARFLITRALLNKRVGHMFFWYLKAEMGQPAFVDRFGLLMEAFLRGAGRHRMELISQYQILDRFLGTANSLKGQKAEERKEFLLKDLAAINFPKRFQLILNPRLEGKGVIVEKCRYFDSKKLPLLLTFENADASSPEPIRVMFKSGDDLRQDMLTMQMIRIMDQVWLDEGLDMQMTPYPVLATGEDQGFLQFVTNSETVSKIQMEYGGARAAFKDEPLDLWLRRQNTTPEAYEKAVSIFTRSCAGYCVATFVLGIGDRHNDNVMLKVDGHLFHIDFGHFLGNIKRKLGIKRERAPFVLTPDFIYVMGRKESENFKFFIELCVKSYLCVRKHANLFIVLFAMMLSTGIPELQDEGDLEYLRHALQVEEEDDVAEAYFRNVIDEAVKKGWSTQLNWLIHNLAHK